MVLTEAKKSRDDYIKKLKEQHKDWSLRDIAKEVKRVYGECSHQHVQNAEVFPREQTSCL